MKKQILKVLMTEDVDCPKVDGYQMITCSEVMRDDVKYIQYEYIPSDADLCEGGNAVREGDEIIYKVDFVTSHTNNDVIELMEEFKNEYCDCLTDASSACELYQFEEFDMTRFFTEKSLNLK